MSCSWKIKSIFKKTPWLILQLCFLAVGIAQPALASEDCYGCRELSVVKGKLTASLSQSEPMQIKALREAGAVVGKMPLDKNGRLNESQIAAITEVLQIAIKIDPVQSIMDSNLRLFEKHQVQFRKAFADLPKAEAEALELDLRIILQEGNDFPAPSKKQKVND